MRNISCGILLCVVISSGCQRSDDTQRLADAGNESSPASTAAIPVAQAAPADLVDLQLRVEQGDRFPLIKTVEQQVVQSSQAATANAVTRLQLSLTLTVVESDPESTVFDVRYTRVHYAHNVNGQHTVYDSGTPGTAIPYDAVPYAGLIGQGYAVRVGRNHQVIELIGHDQFMQRCLARVPADRRQSLMNETAVRFGDQGVAGFVPDTLGILPFNDKVQPDLACRVQEGDSWTLERTLMQPVPVHLDSTCRLVRVTPTMAEIDMAGRITPGQTYAAGSGSVRDSVRILGGTTEGVCTVDRHLGLPLEVRRRELLNLQVSTESGAVIDQEKRITTEIRIFPQERGPVVRGTTPDPQLRPVAAEIGPRDTSVRPIPVTVP